MALHCRTQNQLSRRHGGGGGLARVLLIAAVTASVLMMFLNLRVSATGSEKTSSSPRGTRASTAKPTTGQPRASAPSKGRKGHAVVEPDALEQRKADHLKQHAGAGYKPRRREQQVHENGEVADGAPEGEGGGDTSGDRQSQLLRYRLRYAPKAERQALQRQLNPKLGEMEFEEALADVPFAERMRLRKQDTAPLAESERDRILEELTEALGSISYVPHAQEFMGNGRPTGVLCSFVPANGHDAEHVEEIRQALRVWGDTNTVLFTENATLHQAVNIIGTTVNRAHVDLGRWRVGHHRRVLHRWLLRRRGSTKAQLRGRGELSLPMFYWMWRERAGLFSRCDWFMKADSDSFINRPQLTTQLNDLDPSQAIYLGTQLSFDSRGFNYSQPPRKIYFHVGGPGYVFSRGLMERLRMDECFRSMALDPVWLIHDDVGTGYCATQFTPGVRTVQHRATIAATSEDDLDSLFDANAVDHQCITCVQAVHPLHPSRLAMIVDVLGSKDKDATEPTPCEAVRCGVSLIEGSHPHVGSAWEVPRSLKARMKAWPRSHLSDGDDGGAQ
jgi:hypothetical protein